MQCLIIDDEPAARDILKAYISDTPEIEIAGIFKDALEAKQFLADNEADLIFLDINMPRLSGISFLKTLNHPPKIILTTAYSEYALEGYELNVVDYLLKPFSFERFIKAVDKAREQSEYPAKGQGFITIKADGKLYRINFEQILFAESQGDYITVHTEENKITFNETLKDFCSQLPKSQFSRVHKSYLVSLPKIDYLQGNMIMLGKHSIPVGKSYKESFLQKYTSGL
ncbi:MAG: response regulator transcription factor [Gracilimonas sp.]|nr:response regulator transcription factor [Gracilimonas sp.]